MSSARLSGLDEPIYRGWINPSVSFKLHALPEWCAQAGVGEGALSGDGALEGSERIFIGDAGAGAETAVARLVGFGERVQRNLEAPNT